MKQGKIVLWRDESRFGFIQPDDGDGDVFVHQVNCIDDVARGDRVEFSIRESRTRPGKHEAYDVRLVE
jgi:cold shock CspA family protein